jgi:hypothetical protein
MNTKRLKPLLFGIGLLVVSGTTIAHHGTNISYDQTTTVTLTGVVTEFRLANPHSQLYFDVTDEAGTLVHWAGELNSPGILRRIGWTPDVMEPGDEVTLSLHPSKAGTPVGVVERDEPMIVNGAQLLGTGDQ